jgi:hypothetical protein
VRRGSGGGEHRVKVEAGSRVRGLAAGAVPGPGGPAATGSAIGLGHDENLPRKGPAELAAMRFWNENITMCISDLGFLPRLRRFHPSGKVAEQMAEDDTEQAVIGRLRQIYRSGTFEELFDVELARQVGVLRKRLDPTADIETAHAFGAFHWLRYQRLPQSADQEDFALAARLFMPVFRDRPDAVPPELAAAYGPPPGIPDGIDPVTTVNEASQLATAYQQAGRLDLLVGAVARFRTALAAVPADHPSRGGFFSNLGNALRLLAAAIGDTAMADEAVDISREAVALTAPDDPALGFYLPNLRLSLLARYASKRDPDVLREQLAVERRLGEVLAVDDPERVRHYLDFVGLLHRLFGESGETVLLEEAVTAGRAAVAAVGAGHPKRAAVLSNLTASLRLLYLHQADLALITEAVGTGRAAIAALPPDHPDLPNCLTNLAGALQSLAAATGDTGLLEEAVSHCRLSLAAGPQTGEARALLLIALAASLSTLAEVTRESPALIEAARTRREVVSLTPPDHPDRDERSLALLANCRLAYERTGDESRLREAAVAGQLLADATGGTVSTQGLVLAHDTMSKLAQRSEATVGLQAAVDLARRISRGAERASPEHLTGLALDLGRLYERTGDEAVLSEALAAARQAQLGESADDDPTGQAASNLEVILHDQFARTGELAILMEAVAAGREAVSLTSVGDPRRPGRLSNLGNSLRVLYERTEDVAYLHEAVGISREAAAAEGDEPTKSDRLTNLAFVLVRLASETRQSALANEALTAAWAAVVRSPDHLRRGRHLTGLAGTYGLAFDLTDDVAYLQAACAAGREAVDATAPGRPDRSAHLANLGAFLERLHVVASDGPAIAEAARCYAEAAANEAAPPATRIKAYRELARITLTEGWPADQALAAMDAAVGFLPQVAGTRIARGDRQHALSNMAGFADHVVSTALAASRPDRALVLLEQTRGVLVAEALEARSSGIAALRERAPALATEFQQLSERIEATDLSGGAVADAAAAEHADETSARRRTLYQEWEALLGRIRSISGLAGFMRTPEIADLAAQAGEGPIVFLCLSQPDCHALILAADQEMPVRALRLGRLSRDDAFDQVRKLIVSISVITSGDAELRQRTGARRELHEVFSWMWDAIAEPVLAELGHLGPPADGQEWPRVWWCPVGVLAYLPMHAAGYHAAPDASSHRTVLDRVISSYTPTVRSLAFARADRQRSGPDPARTVLFVAEPGGDGVPELHGVTSEFQVLASLTEGIRLLNRPCGADVLSALPEFRIAHFACHAAAGWPDPGAGCLILRDHRSAPVTVEQISAQRLTGTELAYLSACQTTMNHPQLTDEAVHLTSAFQLAGYRSVVGTLWPVFDRTAVGMTRAFYGHLTNDGASAPDTANAATALHHAVRDLRDQYPDNPETWAAYLHVGV